MTANPPVRCAVCGHYEHEHAGFRLDLIPIRLTDDEIANANSRVACSGGPFYADDLNKPRISPTKAVITAFAEGFRVSLRKRLITHFKGYLKRWAANINHAALRKARPGRGTRSPGRVDTNTHAATDLVDRMLRHTYYCGCTGFRSVEQLPLKPVKKKAKKGLSS